MGCLTLGFVLTGIRAKSSASGLQEMLKDVYCYTVHLLIDGCDGFLNQRANINGLLSLR